VSGQRALGGQPQRPDGRAVLDRVGGRSDQGRAGLRLSKPGAPVQPGAQRLQGGDQQRLELPAGIHAHLDHPGAGKLQHS
jgi:hypothetical protein